MVRFVDRQDAGRQLADLLAPWRESEVVVLGLPRGGVPVAAIVAEALHAPLDVIAVRKLGLPGQPEVAMGAIAEGGTEVLDARIISMARLSPEDVATVEQREAATLTATTTGRHTLVDHLDLTGRVAIIVDDGIATGATARAACLVARQRGAARVIVAVPVAPAELGRGLEGADEVVAVDTPDDFWAVGAHYDRFTQSTEEEVERLLAAARDRVRQQGRPPHSTDTEIAIDVGAVTIGGRLMVPHGARAVIVFAHGSGSGRHSPRNTFVGGRLLDAGIGVLLVDLLTDDEAGHRSAVFDIEVLAGRLGAIIRRLASNPATATLEVGMFGASTGAGAALWAAAQPDSPIAAVVSRGGRPDLARPRLGDIRCPVLLIVGTDDETVLELNRAARAELRCESSLVLIEGATHLFEEPGTLEAVADAAVDWFSRHLAHTGRTPPA